MAGQHKGDDQGWARTGPGSIAGRSRSHQGEDPGPHDPADSQQDQIDGAEHALKRMLPGDSSESIGLMRKRRRSSVMERRSAAGASQAT